MAGDVMRYMKNKAFLPPQTSLKQSLALLKKSHLFIGTDTGPLHMAAALGIPTVAIMGPSDPLRNGPYGEGHEIICRKLPCSNCYKRTCESNECMRMITVDEVYDKVKKRLNIITKEVGKNGH